MFYPCLCFTAPHGLAEVGLGMTHGATAGEGVQNLLCAAQAAAALVALIGAGAGLAILDPIAAFVISGIAIRECVGLWRGEQDDCCAPVGFADPAASGPCCDAGGGTRTPTACATRT